MKTMFSMMRNKMDQQEKRAHFQENLIQELQEGEYAELNCKTSIY